MSKVTVFIDGKKIIAESGKTILEVARENDIEILTMCHLKGLADVGACRLCIVELEGSPRLFSACTTKIADNMIVTTNSERIRRYQRITTELFFAERNHM